MKRWLECCREGADWRQSRLNMIINKDAGKNAFLLLSFLSYKNGALVHGTTKNSAYLRISEKWDKPHRKLIESTVSLKTSNKNTISKVLLWGQNLKITDKIVKYIKKDSFWSRSIHFSVWTVTFNNCPRGTKTKTLKLFNLSLAWKNSDTTTRCSFLRNPIWSFSNKLKIMQKVTLFKIKVTELSQNYNHNF